MKNIGFILLVSMMLFSCEDYFDKAEMPSDILSETITTNKELERMTVASYWAWQGYHEGIFDLGILIPTFTSDEGVISISNDQNVDYGNHDQLYLRNTWNNAIPNLKYVWQSGYETIRMSNFVINFLNEHGAFNDNEAHWEDRIKGECYFNRAYALYTLVRVFAPPYDENLDMDIPAIICDTINTEGPFDTRSLSTVSNVYKQILQDLKNAIYYLPEEYDSLRDPEGYQDRAKKDAAKFMLARVYFQMGKEYWEPSLELINEILDEGKYSLDSDPAFCYMQEGLGNKGSETVFQYASYSSISNWRYPTVYHYLGGGSGYGRRKMFHMNKQFEQFIGWDNQEEREKDERFKRLFVLNQGNIWADRWKSRSYSIPSMRSPELHLTRAVICLLTGMSGGNSTAIDDLNVVRLRAYGNNYIPLDNDYNTQELLNIVHRERSKELFFEGDRLYYIQALRGQIGPGSREGEDYLEYNSEKLYWPIPEAEVNTNQNIN